MGMFFALEGTDGSGKTTIRKHVFRVLREHGMDVLATTGNHWLVPEHTAVIAGARYNGERHPRAAVTRAYVADKEALCNELLRPHLRHRHVLSDRYVISDVVYHSVLFGTPPDVTYRAYAASTVLRPDAVFFIDTPPEAAARHLGERPASRHHPWDAQSTQRRIYDLLRDVALGDSYPELSAPVVRIDNSGPLQDTLDAVTEEVLTRIARTGAHTPDGGTVPSSGRRPPLAPSRSTPSTRSGPAE